MDETLSVEVPADWRMTLQRAGSTSSVQLSIRDLDPQLTLEERMSQLDAAYDSLQGQIEVLANEEARLFGGHDGRLRRLLSVGVDGVRSMHLHAVVLMDGRELEATTVTPVEDFAAVEPELVELLLGLRVVAAGDPA